MSNTSYYISLPSFYTFHSLSREKLVLHDKEKDCGSKRIRNLENHIKAGDYFGTLATIIDFIHLDEDKYEHLDKIKNDLIYLQDNYKISPKK